MNWPNLIFLMETLAKVEKVNRIKEKLGFMGLHIIDCNGHSGGLALFWQDSLSIFILGSQSNFINVKISLEQLGSWRCIGFYGYPERHQRHDSWQLLRHLFSLSSPP